MGAADFAIASVFVGVVAYFAHFGIHHGLWRHCDHCFKSYSLTEAHEYLEMIVDFPVVVIAHALFVAG